MLEDIKRWLATQLIAINSVRHCAIKLEDIRDPERDPSITVHTWSSTIIHVFLLPQLPRIRVIKRILSEGTRLGIGTLFIVNDDLLPDDGERFEPDDVLTSLHALYKDKIYTYRVEDDGPRIGQIHFKAFGRAEQTEVWYGPDITIAHLPSFRVWISTPSSIKGDWLIANFGTEAFWKKADSTAEREKFRRQHRRANASTWHFDWSPSSSWAEAGGKKVDPPPPPPSPETKLEQAFALLGLSISASYEDVKAAFRQMARELHPDVSKLPKDEAEARFKRINEAYGYIKVTNRWT
jgi:hypothetical protein